MSAITRANPPLPSGSKTAPSLRGTDADTGIYFPSDGSVQFTSGGVAGAMMGASRVVMPVLGFVGWSSATDPISAGADTAIRRTAAGELTIAPGVSGAQGLLHLKTVTRNSTSGAQAASGVSTELLTIAAAATTDTSANLLPANSYIEAVTVNVVTAIPTAATFTVGDATTAARFATGVSTALNTQTVGLTHVDQTGAAGPRQTSAAKVRITPNAVPADATGQVRVDVFWRTYTAGTT